MRVFEVWCRGLADTLKERVSGAIRGHASHKWRGRWVVVEGGQPADGLHRGVYVWAVGELSTLKRSASVPQRKGARSLDEIWGLGGQMGFNEHVRWSWFSYLLLNKMAKFSKMSVPLIRCVRDKLSLVSTATGNTQRHINTKAWIFFSLSWKQSFLLEFMDGFK